MQGFVRVQDGQLYYEISGSGPALILIHGMGLDHRMWDEQFAEFSRSFHVICYDVRGYGRSSLPGTESYSHSNDLKQLLDNLSVKQAHVIGLSMGGNIALQFALDFPSAVSSLVLVNSGLSGYALKHQSPDSAGVYLDIEQLAAENRLPEARERWLTLPHFAHALTHDRIRGNLVQMAETYSFWHFVHKDPILRPSVSTVDRLGEVGQHCFVLTGELDLPECQEIAVVLGERLEYCTRLEIPQAGHIANMENPKCFNERVLDFLMNK